MGISMTSNKIISDTLKGKVNLKNNKNPNQIESVNKYVIDLLHKNEIIYLHVLILFIVCEFFIFFKFRRNEPPNTTYIRQNKQCSYYLMVNNFLMSDKNLI